MRARASRPSPVICGICAAVLTFICASLAFPYACATLSAFFELSPEVDPALLTAIAVGMAVALACAMLPGRQKKGRTAIDTPADGAPPRSQMFVCLVIASASLCLGFVAAWPLSYAWTADSEEGPEPAYRKYSLDLGFGRVCAERGELRFFNHTMPYLGGTIAMVNSNGTTIYGPTRTIAWNFPFYFRYFDRWVPKPNSPYWTARVPIALPILITAMLPGWWLFRHSQHKTRKRTGANGMEAPLLPEEPLPDPIRAPAAEDDGAPFDT